MPVQFTCPACSKVFLAPPSRAKRTPTPACSKSCGRKMQPSVPFTDERRAKISAAKTDYWSTHKLSQNTCADCSAGISPYAKRCVSCRGKYIMSKPGVREAASARLSAYSSSPEGRSAIGERTRQRMADPEVRARFSGENNPNWRGGTSLATHRRVAKKRWLKFRRTYLSTHPNICDLCAVVARTLHHRKPVREWPEGEFVESNIQVLCGSCHATVENALKHG